MTLWKYRNQNWAIESGIVHMSCLNCMAWFCWFSWFLSGLWCSYFGLWRVDAFHQANKQICTMQQSRFNRAFKFQPFYKVSILFKLSYFKLSTTHSHFKSVTIFQMFRNNFRQEFTINQINNIFSSDVGALERHAARFSRELERQLVSEEMCQISRHNDGPKS